MASRRPRPRSRMERAPASSSVSPEKSPMNEFLDGLVTKGLRAAERVFTHGVQSELGKISRAFTERVARKMADAENDDGWYDRLANSAKEIWIARAAVAIDACLSELRDKVTRRK